MENARRSRLARSRPASRLADHERNHNSRQRTLGEKSTYFSSRNIPKVVNRNYDVDEAMHISQRIDPDDEDSDDSGDEENDFKRTPEKTSFQGFTSDEKYLIGTLRVPLVKLEAVVVRFPPPPGWQHLPAAERIAYVFHCALWSQYPIDFEMWHNSFNMQFYNLRLQKLTEEDALYEICARMQSHYKEEEEKRLKEEGHLYGGVPEHLRSKNSVLVKKNHGPYKHLGPTTFARFAPDGRLVMIDSSKKCCFITLCRPTLIYGKQELQMLDYIQSFEGSLGNVATTPPHPVAFFIRRRMHSLFLVAQAIWERYSELPDEKLRLLCEISESVMTSGGAGEERLWINHLRKLAETSSQQQELQLLQSETINATTRMVSETIANHDEPIYQPNKQENLYTLDFEAARSPVSTECNIEQASSQSCRLKAVVESHEVDDLSEAEQAHLGPISKEEKFSKNIEQAEFSTMVAVKPPTTPVSPARSPRQDREFETSTSAVMKYSNHALDTPAIEEYQNPVNISATPELQRQDQRIQTPEKGPSDKGLFYRLRDRLSRALPNGAPEMRLPDDNNMEIVWDPQLGRYVGANIKEDMKSKPPPLMIPKSSGVATNIGKRTSVSSRYRSVGMESTRAIEPSPALLGDLLSGSMGSSNLNHRPIPHGLFIPQAGADSDEISPFTLQSSKGMPGPSKELHDHAE